MSNNREALSKAYEVLRETETGDVFMCNRLGVLVERIGADEQFPPEPLRYQIVVTLLSADIAEGKVPEFPSAETRYQRDHEKFCLAATKLLAAGLRQIYPSNYEERVKPYINEFQASGFIGADFELPAHPPY